MEDQILYKNRIDAGKELADFFKKMSILNPVILGLPKGGMVVANEVARLMNAPLDAVIARRIRHPNYPEISAGAISEDEIPLFNPESVKKMSIMSDVVLDVVTNVRLEVRRRVQHYRPARSIFPVKNRTVIIVDDGISTGVAAAAAGKFIKSLSPKQVILGVPVGPPHINVMVRDQFDEVFCLKHIMNFKSVSAYYEDFSPVSDKEVMNILDQYHPVEFWENHGL